MSDENKVLRVKRDIKKASDLPDDAKPPGNYMHQRVTREEMMEGIAVGIQAAAQKMYDQLSQEFAERLEAETSVTVQLAIAHMKWHYSLRGRLTRFMRWLRAPRGGPELVATTTAEPVDDKVYAVSDDAIAEKVNG